jgi:hypothetical protein
MARVGAGEVGDDVVVLAGRMVEGDEGGLELVLDVDEHGVSLAFDPDDGLLHFGHFGLGVGLCSFGLDESYFGEREGGEIGEGVRAKNGASASFATESSKGRCELETHSVGNSPFPSLVRSTRQTAVDSPSSPFRSWLEGRC